MQIKYFPIATICIIVINGIIFAMGLISGEQTQIIRNYGFIPDQIFNARNIENNYDQQNSLNSLLQHSEPRSSPSLSTISDSITRLFTSSSLGSITEQRYPLQEPSGLKISCSHRCHIPSSFLRD